MQFITELSTLLEKVDKIGVKPSDKIAVLYPDGAMISIAEHIILAKVKGKMDFLPAGNSDAEKVTVGALLAEARNNGSVLLCDFGIPQEILSRYKASIGGVKKTAKKKNVERTKVLPVNVPEPIENMTDIIKDPSKDILPAPISTPSESEDTKFNRMIENFERLLGVDVKTLGIGISQDMFLLETVRVIAKSDKDSIGQILTSKYRNPVADKITSAIMDNYDGLKKIADELN